MKWRDLTKSVLFTETDKAQSEYRTAEPACSVLGSLGSGLTLRETSQGFCDVLYQVKRLLRDQVDRPKELCAEKLIQK